MPNGEWVVNNETQSTVMAGTLAWITPAPSATSATSAGSLCNVFACLSICCSGNDLAPLTYK